MTAFAMGDVVILQCDGQQGIGEVVGVSLSPTAPLYDVSLEQVVVKAAEESSLSAASASDIRTLLSALVGQSSPVLTTRELVLRQRYAAFLTTALARLQGGAQKAQCGRDARFEVGETVVAKEGPSLILGTVQMVSLRGDEIVYEIEAVGEVKTLLEAEIAPLGEVARDGVLRLGARVRFLIEGYEHDEAYLGTICRVEPRDGGFEYSLMFDDGDILEGLAATDLEVCSN